MFFYQAEGLGDMYLKDEKISLLDCYGYRVTENGRSIGTLFSGYYHSGKKYSIFTFQNNRYILKQRPKFFENRHYIIDLETTASIGYFLSSGWRWLTGESGKLILNSGVLYNCEESFGILAGLWNTGGKFYLQAGNNKIEYLCDFKLSDIRHVNFTGSIAVDGQPPLLNLVLGLFWIDRKFRRWVRNLDY